MPEIDALPESRITAYTPDKETWDAANDYFAPTGAIEYLLQKIPEQKERVKGTRSHKDSLISIPQIISAFFGKGTYLVEVKDELTQQIDTGTPIGGASSTGVGFIEADHVGLNVDISLESYNGKIKGNLGTLIQYRSGLGDITEKNVRLQTLRLETKGNPYAVEFKSLGGDYRDGNFMFLVGENKTHVFVETMIGDHKNGAVMERGKGLEKPLFVREDTGKTDTPVTDTVVSYIEDTFGLGARI